MESKGISGFFRALFDFSFRTLITPAIIKIIYALTLIVIGLLAIVFIVDAFHSSTGLGVATLVIFAPIGALIYIIYARVFLEFFIAIFRIADSNAELVSLRRREMGVDASPPPAAAPPTEPAVAPPTEPPAAAPTETPDAPPAEPPAAPPTEPPTSTDG